MTNPHPTALPPPSPSTPSASEFQWAAARGAKWNRSLAGMEAMLAPVDAPLIRALRLDAACRIADLGCGGGATALQVLRMAPAGSTVHGFDLSPASIESARQRIPPGSSTIAFDTADLAVALPPTGPYDRLVSRFGVMFFPDEPAAFANLARWLAPGGRFAFAVWGPVSDNPWMKSVRDAVERVVAVPSAPGDAPGPFRHADAGRLLRLLDEAGLVDLQSQAWRGALPVGGERSAAQAADFALSSFASFGELLAQAGDEARQQAHRSLTAHFERHERDGAVWMDASVHLVTGTRAGGQSSARTTPAGPR